MPDTPLNNPDFLAGIRRMKGDRAISRLFANGGPIISRKPLSLPRLTPVAASTTEIVRALN